MGKLDATQQRLRALLRVKVDGTGGDGPWSKRLPGVLKAYNEKLGHEGSFGSTPQEVIGPTPKKESDTNLLDFQVMRQMARNLQHNTELNQKNKDAVLADGAFRHAMDLKDSKFNTSDRISRLRYSENVHQADGEEGPFVKDTDGELFNPKLVKAVPVGSKDIRPPDALRKGQKGFRYDKRIKQKQALWPAARTIHQWLQTQAGGAAHLVITRKYENNPQIKNALASVNLGFLRMGKEQQS